VSGCRLARALTREVERYDQARERRAQLVRDVSEQTISRAHQSLDARRHLVEVATHRRKLVSTPAEQRTYARRQVATRHAPRYLSEFDDRRDDVAREQI